MALSVRASPSGVCQAERQRFEPRLLLYISTVYLALFELTLLLCLIVLRADQTAFGDEKNKEKKASKPYKK